MTSLLVAAADPVGDPLLLQRACLRLGITLSAVDATDGLLTMGERVKFRHPLTRSADVFGWLTAGVFGEVDSTAIPLDEVRAAYVALEGRRTTGKLVLTI